jgi:hypothetical protein
MPPRYGAAAPHQQRVHREVRDLSRLADADRRPAGHEQIAAPGDLVVPAGVVAHERIPEGAGLAEHGGRRALIERERERREEGQQRRHDTQTDRADGDARGNGPVDVRPQQCHGPG